MKTKLFLSLLCIGFLASKIFCQTEKWEIYNQANSGLPNDMVKFVFTARDSSVWIGSESGLTHFDGSTWNSYHTGNSQLPDNIVTAIADGLTGNYIWVGTFTGGLCKFDGTNWTIYNKSNSGIPDDYILCIQPELNLASEEILWVGTKAGGAASFYNNLWTVYNYTTTGAKLYNQINTIAHEDNGIKWFGTWDGGLGKFDGTNWTIFNKLNSGITNNSIYSIAIDKNHNKWLGSKDGGLIKYTDIDFFIFNQSNSQLSHNSVRDVKTDGQNRVWAATLGGGLNRFDGTNWQKWDITNSQLPDNWIWGISLEGDNKVHIGTNNGYAVYSVCAVSNFSQSPVLCFGQSITVGNNIYTVSGNYKDTLSNVNGCDSIITTQLTVISKISTSQTLTINEGESVQVGNNIYKSTGTYIDTLTSSNECDSVVTTNLTVITGVIEIYKDVPVRLYPNPTNGKTALIFENLQNKSINGPVHFGFNSIEIFNITGEKVFSSISENIKVLDLTSFRGSIYFVHFKTDNGIFIHKLVITRGE